MTDSPRSKRRPAAPDEAETRGTVTHASGVQIGLILLLVLVNLLVLWVLWTILTAT